MEAKELRIGNMIHSQGFVLVVDAILKDGNISTSMGTGYIDEFDPIPLTEDWLLKFGFDKDGLIMEGGVKCYEVIYDSTLGYYDFAVYNMGGDKVICANPEHVHQLQNLYFALTGEELTTKTI